MSLTRLFAGRLLRVAKPIIDISILGAKKLERALAKLPAAAQKRAVRPGLRQIAKMVRTDVVDQIKTQGLIETGRLLRAWQVEVKPKSGKRSRVREQVILPLPTRAQMLLAPDEFYYPVVVEYGHRPDSKAGAQPHPYVRRGTDARTPQKRFAMSQIVIKKTRKEFVKLNRRAPAGL